MAVYVIVIAAVILLLAGSYRAFGGGQQGTPDVLELLAQGHRALADNLADLAQLIATTPTEDMVRQGRKGAAALQHIVDLLPSGGALSDVEQQLRGLLAAAAEDLSWAWRLAATSGAHGEGLAEAVGKLREHAARCAAEANALLRGLGLGQPSRAEPLEGS